MSILASGFAIMTYGDVDILYEIFSGIAQLVNNDTGSLKKPLMLLGSSIGMMWVIMKAMFSPNAQAFLSSYFIPLVAIVGILNVPSQQVTIQDVITNDTVVVDNVPMFLGRTAEIISTLGYQVTKAFELVFHNVQDGDYNKTGLIFGNSIAKDMSKLVIQDGVLEQNVRTFIRQCVVFDLALGRYSMSDLKNSTDLWDLFEKSSNILRMNYTGPTTETESTNEKWNLIRCREAAHEIKARIGEERLAYMDNEFYKHIPAQFQAMTKLQENTGKILEQHLMISALGNEIGSESYAAKRAAIQQQSTYQTIGTLAGKSLIAMRMVFEALIYVAFIFILPMFLLPNGISYLGRWLILLIWIQLWPPLFVVLQFIVTFISQKYSDGIISLGGNGYSITTSMELLESQQNLMALAGYLAVSIPFISYSLVQGGLSSFMHLASSMMTPAHQAGSAAAAEISTGNHSFGNISHGGFQYENRSHMKYQCAPELSAGYTKKEGIHGTQTLSENDEILQVRKSDINCNMRKDFSTQTQHDNSRSEGISNQKSDSNSWQKSSSIINTAADNFSKGIQEMDTFGSGRGQITKRKKSYAKPF